MLFSPSSSFWWCCLPPLGGVAFPLSFCWRGCFGWSHVPILLCVVVPLFGGLCFLVPPFWWYCSPPSSLGAAWPPPSGGVVFFPSLVWRCRSNYSKSNITHFKKERYVKVKWWWPFPSFFGVGAAFPLPSPSFGWWVCFLALQCGWWCLLPPLVVLSSSGVVVAFSLSRGGRCFLGCSYPSLVWCFFPSSSGWCCFENFLCGCPSPSGGAAVLPL